MDEHAQSRRFICRACGEYHTLPESGYPNCNQPPRLVKVEKPLSPQAKQLQTVVKHVREGLDKLHQFDAREHVQQECERLELQVSEAAERATQADRSNGRKTYSSRLTTTDNDAWTP